MPGQRQTRLLVVYPFMPHYRFGVFKGLDEHAEMSVTFASDLHGEGGIEVIDPELVSHHAELRNVRIGRSLWQRGLLRLIAARNFDAAVILGNAAHLSTWVAALLGRLRGMRVYLWTIGWHRPDTGLKRVLRLAFYHLAHALLLYGETGRRIGESMGYPSDRMFVIGNSISPADPRHERTKPHESWDISIPEGAKVVGAVIRLTPQKRLDMLIRAGAVIARRGTNIVILLVGDGPERNRLSSLAEELGVRLLLPGAFYSPETLRKVYSTIDVTVVPAAVGLTAIQSMSYGVPVVSDDDAYGQMPEWEAIRPGETGELYRAGDIADLALSIERMLDRVSSDSERVARACELEVSRRWSPQVQVDAIAQIVVGDTAARDS